MKSSSRVQERNNFNVDLSDFIIVNQVSFRV